MNGIFGSGVLGIKKFAILVGFIFFHQALAMCIQCSWPVISVCICSFAGKKLCTFARTLVANHTTSCRLKF